MKNIVLKLFITIFAFPFCHTLEAAGNLQPETPDSSLVIRNVQVIDIENGQVLENRDIWIEDERIIEIGVDLKVSDAEEIDLSGHYVIPALFDMHAHIAHQNPWHEYQLALYRYFGIHYTQFMTGNEGLRKLADDHQIPSSDFIAPQIFLASELIDGDPPRWGEDHDGPVITDPEEVETHLEQLKEKGYSDIKVYDQLSEEVYLEILETAGKLGLRVVGHVPHSLSAENRLDARHQRIDHLEGYLELAFDGESSSDSPNRNELLNGFSRERMAEAAGITADRKIWNTPTHVVFSSLLDSAYTQEVMYGEFSNLPDPTLQNFWNGAAQNPNAMPHLKSEKFRKVHLEMIQILHESGAKIMAGTDAPLPVLLYGHSIHKELQYFVDAGMSPAEALETATVHPADFLELDNLGKIKEGYQAELVFLKENPLEDISNTLTFEGYFSGNQYMPQKNMKKLLLTIREELE